MNLILNLIIRSEARYILSLVLTLAYAYFLLLLTQNFYSIWNEVFTYIKANGIRNWLSKHQFVISHAIETKTTNWVFQTTIALGLVELKQNQS